MAGLAQLRAHQANGLHRCLLAARRRRDDDGVAALERHHGLVDRRRRRVGRRADRADDADRLAVFHQAARRQFLDNADRFDPHQVAQGAEGLAGVLDDLALDVAEAGVLDREFGQHPGVFRLVDRPGKGGDGFVDPRLIVVLIGSHCRPRPVDQAGDDRFRAGLGSRPVVRRRQDRRQWRLFRHRNLRSCAGRRAGRLPCVADRAPPPSARSRRTAAGIREARTTGPSAGPSGTSDALSTSSAPRRGP